MKNITKWVFVSGILFLSCSSSQTSQKNRNLEANVPVNGKLFGTAYMQTAAEYRALCYQTYRLAALSLDNIMLTGKYAHPIIITDIDETILDNSAYQAKRSLSGADYSKESWFEWTAKSAADTIPGAPSFFKYAASKGVEVFYITNRYEQERAATLKNLEKFDFPFVDNEHLLMRETVSSKESRRQRLMKDHTVLMLLGDNMGDLDVLFDSKPLAERNRNVQQLSADFGVKYIVLPNPVYGDWESALYQNSHKLSTAQKDSAIRSAVRGY